MEQHEITPHRRAALRHAYFITGFASVLLYGMDYVFLTQPPEIQYSWLQNLGVGTFGIVAAAITFFTIHVHMLNLARVIRKANPPYGLRAHRSPSDPAQPIPLRRAA